MKPMMEKSSKQSGNWTTSCYLTTCYLTPDLNDLTIGTRAQARLMYVTNVVGLPQRMDDGPQPILYRELVSEDLDLFADNPSSEIKTEVHSTSYEKKV